MRVETLALPGCGGQADSGVARHGLLLVWVLLGTEGGAEEPCEKGDRTVRGPAAVGLEKEGPKASLPGGPGWGATPSVVVCQPLCL